MFSQNELEAIGNAAIEVYADMDVLLETLNNIAHTKIRPVSKDTITQSLSVNPQSGFLEILNFNNKSIAVILQKEKTESTLEKRYMLAPGTTIWTEMLFRLWNVHISETPSSVQKAMETAGGIALLRHLKEN